MSKLSTALVTLTLSEKALSGLRSAFSTVHYHPSSVALPGPDVLGEIEILFGPPNRLKLDSFDQVPKLRYIQLGSAGADGPLSTPVLKDWVSRQSRDDTAKKDEREIKMMTASGTHVLSIPPWAVGCVIMLYHQLPRMLAIGKVSPVSYLTPPSSPVRLPSPVPRVFKFSRPISADSSSNTLLMLK